MGRAQASERVDRTGMEVESEEEAITWRPQGPDPPQRHRLFTTPLRPVLSRPEPAGNEDDDEFDAPLDRQSDYSHSDLEVDWWGFMD